MHLLKNIHFFKHCSPWKVNLFNDKDVGGFIGQDFWKPENNVEKKYCHLYLAMMPFK